MYLKYLFCQSICKTHCDPRILRVRLGFVFGVFFFYSYTNNFIFELSVLDVRFYPAKHFFLFFNTKLNKNEK